MMLKKITAAATLVGLAAGAAQAGGDPAGADAAQATVTSSAEHAVESRRVVRDAVTGKLRAPSEEELATERAARKASGKAEFKGPSAPLIVRQHANGMRSAVLGTEYMSTLQAERKADGRLVVRHANPAHEHQAPRGTQPNSTTE